MTIIALKRCIHKMFPNITEHFSALKTIIAEEIDSFSHRNINLQTPNFSRNILIINVSETYSIDRIIFESRRITIKRIIIC